jgi:hypothetical protein
VIGALAAAACSSGGQQAVQFDEPANTTGSTGVASTNVTLPSTRPSDVTSTEVPSTTQTSEDAVPVRIDASAPGDEISPLILGLSTNPSADELRSAGIQLNSWGGNPSSRYNYKAGHLWNAASDWEFRNTDYGQEGDSYERFAQRTAAAGAEARLAVPTMGWIAKDNSSCSFPEGDSCLGDREWDCESSRPVADPKTTSVRSTPDMVADWVASLGADGHAPRFVAMDNEPELWGHTHYDVHPECPTYEEILDRYLEYATAIRAVAPDAELTGPVMCCWYDYWNTAPGPADGSDADFLTWFLTRVREHDEEVGARTLDVVDVHFYPQTNVYNDELDGETAARRLRSVRALWDGTYEDESWINATIQFIPRMKRTIDAAYPGLPLMISEWNFGADGSTNGAVAIADVLAVYGREGVYAAAYWRSPEPESPGYFAFKMHGNYDSAGSSFSGATVPAISLDAAVVSAYGALDESTGVLRVMLLNKLPADAQTVGLDFEGFEAAPSAERWTYGSDDPSTIVHTVQDVTAPIRLPAESITVLELVPS